MCTGYNQTPSYILLFVILVLCRGFRVLNLFIKLTLCADVFSLQEKLAKSIHYLISKEDQVRAQITDLDLLINQTEVRADSSCCRSFPHSAARIPSYAPSETSHFARCYLFLQNTHIYTAYTNQWDKLSIVCVRIRKVTKQMLCKHGS